MTTTRKTTWSSTAGYFQDSPNTATSVPITTRDWFEAMDRNAGKGLIGWRCTGSLPDQLPRLLVSGPSGRSTWNGHPSAQWRADHPTTSRGAAYDARPMRLGRC